MDALRLVQQLRRDGIRLTWGSRGWQALQDESEVRFGCPEARLYPFLRLELMKSPVVRTDLGPARLVRVVPGGCDVVFQLELDEWERDCLVAERTLPFPPMTRLRLEQVYPPATPPEEVL